MAVSARVCSLALACVTLGLPASAQGPASHIPVTRATALDGHDLTLPRDLVEPATVLILGFGRHSQDATTAWERPVRQGMARAGTLGFFDMAMLAEVPGFVRPLVLRSIRKAVPDVLKAHFLPLTDNEDAWKRVAGYDTAQPDAAYVMLVDRSGAVHWSTHQAFTPAGLELLRRQAQQLSTTAH